MQGFVHFSVGVFGAMLILLEFEEPLPIRWELPFAFLSGVWATVPDWHWLLIDEHGPAIYYAPTVAAFLNNQVHDTRLMNVFWFHRVLDLGETGNPGLEARIALAGVVAIGIGYVYTRIE